MALRAAVASAAVMVVAALFLLLRGTAKVTYRDEYVTAGEIRRAIDSVAVHSSRPQFLTVNGKTYTSVRGLRPFYTALPGSNSILFVTQDSQDTVTFHIANITNRQTIHIKDHASGFGWGIRSDRVPGEEGTDYVEGVGSNTVRIASRSRGRKTVTTLDLARRDIDREEIFFYDQDGIPQLEKALTREQLNGLK